MGCKLSSNKKNAQHHTMHCFCVNTNGDKYGTITYDVMHSHLGYL